MRPEWRPPGNRNLTGRLRTCTSSAFFLNAGSVISTDGVDGLHLTAEAERKLGVAVAAKVKEMLK